MESAQSHGIAISDGRGGAIGHGGDFDCATMPRRRLKALGKGRGVSSAKAKKTGRDDSAASSSSSSSSSFSSSSFFSSFSSSSDSSLPSHSSRMRPLRRRLRLKSRSVGLWVFTRDRADECHQGLALPLGMAFAVVVSQVFRGNNLSGKRVQIDHLSMICTSAVKEAITNIHGRKFDGFIRNFSKSFHSTFKTLGLVNGVYVDQQENTCCSCVSESRETRSDLPSHELVSTLENLKDDIPLNYANNQLILHGQISEHLTNIYRSSSKPEFGQSILSTMQRSVSEQTRSNDLKAFELELVMQKLQMKQSQLILSSQANSLEKTKISLGISKASFKEEKLKNQMLETKYAQLSQRCMDLLVTGLIVMCALLVYGASIYSYERITEVTSACNYSPKESRPWWFPKQMQTFNSGLHTLRCHFVAATRMSFGILMILAIAYTIFQRSASSTPTMPVTFIVLLLGALCGLCGKLCVDTLGGSGYHWLIYWEMLCALHFLAIVFPSVFYLTLYGPVTVSEVASSARLPYWLRRYSFYALLLLILPMSCGLLPFASVDEWKVHFTEKLAF